MAASAAIAAAATAESLPAISAESRGTACSGPSAGSSETTVVLHAHVRIGIEAREHDDERLEVDVLQRAQGCRAHGGPRVRRRIEHERQRLGVPHQAQRRHRLEPDIRIRVARLRHRSQRRGRLGGADLPERANGGDADRGSLRQPCASGTGRPRSPTALRAPRPRAANARATLLPARSSVASGGTARGSSVRDSA